MVFQKGNKQARRQVSLRGSKFIKKGHNFFTPIYCQKQPSKVTLEKRCFALVVKNFEKYILRTPLFKYVNILSTFQTNQGVIILKKHQEVLN